MDSELDGCRPAAYVLNVGSINCDKCPFPFCVVYEASIIKYELKEHMTRIMRQLGNSMEETAKAMEVSLRSVYRYTSVREDGSCTQCNLVHSQYVMCKSDTYSVAYRGGQYIIVLNKHQHATPIDLKVVECFTEYVFPSSNVEKSKNGHDYWVLSRVEPEEEKNFGRMCDALNKYTLSLSRGVECLQQVR